MDSRDARIAVNQAKAFLVMVNNLVEAIEVSADAESRTAAAVAAREEAEVGYRLAHNERAQIIEAIENLKAQHTKAYTDLNAERVEALELARVSVLDANLAAFARIAAVKAEVEKVEADAAQRIAAAEVAVTEAEARIETAKEALEALKRA